MAPKKAKIQGFWLFTYNWRDQKAKEGMQYSLEEAMALCDPIWKSMDPHTRDTYKNMAKSKNVLDCKVAERYTSQGVTFSAVEAAEKEKNLIARKKTIKILEILETAYHENTLATQQFFIISFNHFCWAPKWGYIPAELGLIRFSMENGVEEKLHAFIYQRALPLGTAYEAKEISESTHMLPQPPDSKGDPCYNYLEEIQRFLGNGKKMPPVFTNTRDVVMVEEILKDINIMVCSTAELLFHLKEKTRKYDLDEKGYENVHIAQILMDRDTYEYAKGLACNFHDEETNIKHCALHRCIRWGYLLADQCAVDLHIDLLAGVHLPDDANTTGTPSFDITSFTGTESDITSRTRSSITLPQWKYVSTTKEGTAEDSRIEKPRKSLDKLLYQLSDTNPFREEIKNKSLTGSNPSNFKLVDETVESKRIHSNPWSRSGLLQRSRDFSDDDLFSGVGTSKVNLKPLEPQPVVLKGKGRGVILNEIKELNMSISDQKIRSAGRGNLLPKYD